MSKNRKSQHSNQPRQGRHPQPIAEVMSELMTRKGYARVCSGEDFQDAWKGVADEFDSESRATQVSRGVLEVVVRSSTVLQEITFRKHELLQALVKKHPELRVTDIRFRVGKTV